MTAQVSETLIYHGKELMMFSNPLDPYLRAAGLHFESMNTANWRGYEGTWEIKGSEATGEGLYLVRLEANRSFDEVVGLAEIFPGFPDGVFAHWYTGTLRCPQGALLKYVHGGFGSVYEEDLFFDVTKGVVTNERLVRNGTAAPDASKGYTLAAATSIGD